MKFVYPEINQVFEIGEEYVNTLVVENQRLFVSFVEDMIKQISGEEGLAVLSENDKILPFEKSVEVLDQFIPFELNQKAILNKITAKMSSIAMDGEHFQQTAEMLSNIEKFLSDVSFDLPCDLDFSGVSVEGLVKASGMRISDDYPGIAEKVIDYIELVNEFVHEKVFILINFRSYISDEDVQLFINTVLQHKYKCIMIESHEYERVDHEKRYVIDTELCEIQ